MSLHKIPISLEFVISVDCVSFPPTIFVINEEKLAGAENDDNSDGDRTRGMLRLSSVWGVWDRDMLAVGLK